MRLFHSILATLLLFVSTTVWGSNEPSRLVVELLDGTTDVFVLADKPVITFDSERVYVNSTSFSAELTSVARFYFPDETAVVTRVDDIKEEVKANFSFKFVDGQTVVIGGLKATDRISVYTVNGMKCNAEVSHNGDQTVVSLGGLANGHYIIRTNNQSFKVYKR